MKKHPKRPKDSAELAKLIVDIASHETPNDPYPFADEAASKRGHARADALTARRRKAIAKKAAKSRWERDS